MFAHYNPKESVPDKQCLPAPHSNEVKPMPRWVSSPTGKPSLSPMCTPMSQASTACFAPNDLAGLSLLPDSLCGSAGWSDSTGISNFRFMRSVSCDSSWETSEGVVPEEEILEDREHDAEKVLPEIVGMMALESELGLRAQSVVQAEEWLMQSELGLWAQSVVQAEEWLMQSELGMWAQSVVQAEEWLMQSELGLWAQAVVQSEEWLMQSELGLWAQIVVQAEEWLMKSEFGLWAQSAVKAEEWLLQSELGLWAQSVVQAEENFDTDSLLKGSNFETDTLFDASTDDEMGIEWITNVGAARRAQAAWKAEKRMEEATSGELGWMNQVAALDADGMIHGGLSVVSVAEPALHAKEHAKKTAKAAKVRAARRALAAWKAEKRMEEATSGESGWMNQVAAIDVDGMVHGGLSVVSVAEPALQAKEPTKNTKTAKVGAARRAQAAWKAEKRMEEAMSGQLGWMNQVAALDADGMIHGGLCVVSVAQPALQAKEYAKTKTAKVGAARRAQAAWKAEKCMEEVTSGELGWMNQVAAIDADGTIHGGLSVFSVAEPALQAKEHAKKTAKVRAARRAQAAWKAEKLMEQATSGEMGWMNQVSALDADGMVHGGLSVVSVAEPALQAKEHAKTKTAKVLAARRAQAAWKAEKRMEEAVSGELGWMSQAAAIDADGSIHGGLSVVSVAEPALQAKEHAQKTAKVRAARRAHAAWKAEKRMEEAASGELGWMNQVAALDADGMVHGGLSVVSVAEPALQAKEHARTKAAKIRAARRAQAAWKAEKRLEEATSGESGWMNQVAALDADGMVHGGLCVVSVAEPALQAKEHAKKTAKVRAARRAQAAWKAEKRMEQGTSGELGWMNQVAALDADGMVHGGLCVVSVAEHALQANKKAKEAASKVRAARRAQAAWKAEKRVLAEEVASIDADGILRGRMSAGAEAEPTSQAAHLKLFHRKRLMRSQRGLVSQETSCTDPDGRAFLWLALGRNWCSRMPRKPSLLCRQVIQDEDEESDTWAVDASGVIRI